MPEFATESNTSFPGDYQLPEAFAASPEELAMFFRGYTECMLFANVVWGTETGDAPEGYDAQDLLLTDENLRDLAPDVVDFIDANYIGLTMYVIRRGFGEAGWKCAGNDFAFTRNGHGTGFWDRGIDDLGQHLTEASRPYGSQCISVEIVDDDVHTYIEG